MQSKINEIKAKFDEEIKHVHNAVELDEIRVNYLGKKGSVNDIMKIMPSLTNDERKEFGIMVNSLKNELERKILSAKQQIEEEEIQKQLETCEKFDFSLPCESLKGSLHPISLVQQELEDIFKKMGFIIEEGNEIESEYNNFESLNIPSYHPARDMQDTYFLNNGQLLKTHTSASQNRLMKKYGVPLRVIFPGRCFRNENLDASHETTFFQLEGIMIDENLSISNLIYFMKTMLTEVFKTEVSVRLRPGFFPFVEPGFELDMSCVICGGKGCQTCKKSGWIELVPCGMIHPRVLEMAGIDPEKYRGFAFGLGLTRLAMMKYGIKNIRVLNSGNLKVLQQFKNKLY